VLDECDIPALLLSPFGSNNPPDPGFIEFFMIVPLPDALPIMPQSNSLYQLEK